MSATAPFDWSDPLALDAQLNDDERMIRDQAKCFAEAELAPGVVLAAREGRFDRAIMRGFGEMGLRIDVPHASLGTTPGVASPLRLSATPPVCERGPPVLGQDTGAVLGEVLGLDPGEIEALFVDGVVAGAR
ncbi:acyl-CoA dehydrogenase family protein [Caulobacter sp. LjRoot300]|uniref:acyl-CoA dehydrogenase family protein n=1 Tax=Caulobacter sp. LjRoot300 TaxID=3342321 RepID=UPI003ED0046C